MQSAVSEWSEIISGSVSVTGLSAQLSADFCVQTRYKMVPSRQDSVIFAGAELVPPYEHIGIDLQFDVE